MSEENEQYDVEKKTEKNIERKTDTGQVASTFIKYAAYIIILLIVLWFLKDYILPMF